MPEAKQNLLFSKLVMFR